MDIQYRSIDDLKAYENNPRNNDPAVDAVAASIKNFGFRVPIVIDKNDVIVCGHTRVKAAEKIGMKVLPCVVADDLDEEKINAFRLADNKTAELAEWDIEKLVGELQDISEIDMSEFGFDVSVFEEEKEPEVVDDEFDGQVSDRTVPGDLYELGEHRLICGDSTDPNVLEKLMNGMKADMVFTDPPYNIAGESKNFAADCSKSMKKLKESEWDLAFEMDPFLVILLEQLKTDVSVYICSSHFLAGDIWQWMKEWSDHYSYCIWNKPNPMPSLAKRHWTWNTELICYATRGKHTFNFPKEGHALSDWSIAKKNGSTGHPTEKPVEVPAHAIQHSSKKNDIVLDCFGGSGSTLMACEQLERKCYMVELDPHYCDVIVSRWEKFTGKKAIRNGETTVEK